MIYEGSLILTICYLKLFFINLCYLQIKLNGLRIF